jgi:pimeloyl-ACP methyl ester carboxylesterase
MREVEMATSNRTAQTLTLRDGRTLGYAEWGDFNGKPVFYFTSSEASRYSRHPDETILTGLGIHLYTFDRPGRGLSTPHKNRRLLDWADDIREFVQQKNIARFAMIGHSQGCAHCLACAYALPERVNGIALVSPAAGFDDAEVRAQQSRYLRTQLFMSRYAPWLMTFQWNVLRATLKGKRGEKILLDGMRSLPQRDQETLTIPGSHDVLFQSMREALRQGGTGVTDDFRLVANNWGFPLQDIQCKVFIWHGEADNMITPSMSRYLAARIPNNETNFVPEEGSLLIYSRWRDILSRVAAGLD